LEQLPSTSYWQANFVTAISGPEQLQCSQVLCSVTSLLACLPALRTVQDYSDQSYRKLKSVDTTCIRYVFLSSVQVLISSAEASLQGHQPCRRIMDQYLDSNNMCIVHSIQTLLLAGRSGSIGIRPQARRLQGHLQLALGSCPALCCSRGLAGKPRPCSHLVVQPMHLSTCITQTCQH